MAKVHVVTEFSPESIRQRLDFSMGDNAAPDLIGEKTVEIMNLRDKGIREALVKLGWTPPPEADTGSECYGHVVFQNDQLVVRVKDITIETKVFLHRKSAGGLEQLPRGYMLGSNLAIMEKKHA